MPLASPFYSFQLSVTLPLWRHLFQGQNGQRGITSAVSFSLSILFFITTLCYRHFYPFQSRLHTYTLAPQGTRATTDVMYLGHISHHVLAEAADDYTPSLASLIVHSQGKAWLSRRYPFSPLCLPTYLCAPAQ